MTVCFYCGPLVAFVLAYVGTWILMVVLVAAFFAWLERREERRWT